MFENCSVMLINENNSPIEICKLELAADAQNKICRIFSDATNEMRTNKTKLHFDGSYKPHKDEYLVIGNFQLCDEIKDAVRNPIGVSSYVDKSGVFPSIKAIFVGKREENGNTEKFTISFQRFRKEQRLTHPNGISIYFQNNTFVQETRFGINVSDIVDCCFDENELQFFSYYYARQVFDLSDYYRSATEDEVIDFANNEKLTIQSVESFKESANTWIRRKIAVINDSGVLKNYTASKIKSFAKAAGIDVKVVNKKILIPTDKEAVKIILGFLDEEAWKGPFSKKTFLANSKRVITN